MKRKLYRVHGVLANGLNYKTLIFARTQGGAVRKAHKLGMRPVIEVEFIDKLQRTGHRRLSPHTSGK